MGKGGTLFCYVGNDSSLVYFSVTPGSHTPNDSLIKKQKPVLTKEILPDSASFEGKDGLNTYWKEIINKEMIYGYSRVSGKKKKMFDEVLQSVKVN